VRRAAQPGAGEQHTSLPLGYLAIVPLIVAHEWGASVEQRSVVNLAAWLLSRPLVPFGARAPELGWLIYGLLAGLSLVLLFRAEYALLPRLLRIFGEGALAALVLGPLLVFLCWILGLAGAESSLRSGIPAQAPALARVGVLCGGAAFEELVFRLGVLSIAYLAVRRGLLGLHASPRAAGAVAEVAGLSISALVFALSHLRLVVEPLAGSGGEPFDASVFTWRLLAGILLGVLFRWRGMGVAAWAHALFNLALYIGAGPDVFL